MTVKLGWSVVSRIRNEGGVMNIQRELQQGQVPYTSTPVVVEKDAASLSDTATEKAAGGEQRGLLDARLHWCRLSRTQTGQRDEKEGWLAEEEGLHDAALGRERVELIRLCYPSQVERYRLGFQDGQTLLRIPLAAIRQHHGYGNTGSNRLQPPVRSDRRRVTGAFPARRRTTDDVLTLRRLDC